MEVRACQTPPSSQKIDALYINTGERERESILHSTFTVDVCTHRDWSVADAHQTFSYFTTGQQKKVNQQKKKQKAQ
jgi:hypothetical protein